jgi:diacylglycerol kinase family enzyme
MKKVQLIHNPRAGAKKHRKRQLVSMLKKSGYDCRYSSTKKGNWKDFDNEEDLLVIAGGDGTVRKVVAEILKRKLLDKPERLALLPFGTANNIGRAISINNKNHTEIISRWSAGHQKGYDIGQVFNVPGEKFFLESMGFGVFPCLMKKMDRSAKEKVQSAGEELDLAVEMLRTIVLNYKASFCEIEIDGKKRAGKFLLVEIMNTPSIGPRLQLAPIADVGDGFFEIVMVTEKEREKLAKYLEKKNESRESAHSFQVVRGKNITVRWEGSDAHVDDRVIDLQPGDPVAVRLKKGLLNFVVE